jgi:ATP-dependent RNA helicase HelY
VEVTHWADVTRLPDGRPAVDLPRDVHDVEGPVDDARRHLGPRVWRGIQAALAKLDLPDLAGVESRRLDAARRELDERAGHAGERQSRHASDVAQLEEAVTSHPCVRCPVRADHERALRTEQAAIRALAEAEAHESLLEERAASQAERTLDSLTAMLRRFGYLEPAAESDSLRPTSKTAALARLYDPNGLLLLNLAWDAVFDALAPAELMELLSWFCYDRDGPRWNRHQLTPRLWDLRPQIGEALDRVRFAEEQAGLGITLGPNSAFYGPVLAWCRRATFAELLEKIPISEGDLLLTLNKTLDLATQLRESLRTSSANTSARTLAAKLDVGDKLLRRGIVAQSLKLATGLPDQVQAE